MSRLSTFICAAALCGGLAVSGAAPAASQDLQIGMEELAITGLAIAGGLLIYQAIEDANDEQDAYYNRYNYYRDNGYWSGPPRCRDRFVPPGLVKHGCRPPGHAYGHYKRRHWN